MSVAALADYYHHPTWDDAAIAIRAFLTDIARRRKT
jgi:hypothetical protein